MNKKLILLINVLLTLLVIGGSGYYVFYKNDELRFYKEAHADYSARVDKLKDEVAAAQKTYDDNKGEATELEYGADKKLISTDRKEIKKVFEPVFSWKSGAGYDMMRANLIERFGKDSSLVTEYVPENIKVEVTDPKYANNDIDINKRKAHMKDLDVYPVSWNVDGTISYLVFVEYQIYVNEIEKQYEGSETFKAYIRLTMKPGNSGASRDMSNVEAFDLIKF